MWKGLVHSPGHRENPQRGKRRRPHFFLTIGSRECNQRENFRKWTLVMLVPPGRSYAWDGCATVVTLGVQVVIRLNSPNPPLTNEHAGIQRNKSITWQVINTMKERKKQTKNNRVRRREWQRVREELRKEWDNRCRDAWVLIPALLLTCVCVSITGSQSPAL